jgi:Tol biopolymer transport system component
MSLQIGQQFGSYEITSLLGKGGMGEVYRARDTRLKREVAIKALSDEFSRVPDRLARFQREAEALAALNHPNISGIYHLQESNGSRYLVLELVEGDTLADILAKRGALPVDEAVRIAKQICEALEAAHEKGITHRDLKPANIKVTDDGRVKVLDFGLAKIQESSPASSLSSSPTMVTAATSAVILGTASYMSPEQAKGKDIDRATDVWALACVLYEMLTGHPVFEGETVGEILEAIFKSEPDWNRLRPETPAALRKLLRRCLQKEVTRRFRDARDVRIELEELLDKSDPTIPSTTGPAEDAKRWGDLLARRRWLMLTAITVVAVSACVAGWYIRDRREVETAGAPIMRLTSDFGLTTDPALSPDGKLVAYASDRAGGDNLDIWVQQIDGSAPLQLTSDPANEYDPSFSPDGSKIVFRSDRDGGGIYTIPALGGDARLIAKSGHNPSFSPDGSRIAFVKGLGGLSGMHRADLFVVPSTGGTPQKLVPGEIGAASPVWSPDGKFILFARDKYRLDDWAIVPVDISQPVPAATEQQMLAAAPTGHWGPLILLPVEVFKKAGLADLIPRYWLGNRILFSAKMGDASHVFTVGLSPPGLFNRQWRLDPIPKRLTFGTGLEEKPSLAFAASATRAHRVAFVSLAHSENIWSVSLDGDHPKTDGKAEELTHESGFHIFPSISRDGTKLTFISHAAYNDTVWLLDVVNGKRSLLSTAVSEKWKSYIRADGTDVFYGDNRNLQDYGIFRISTSGGTPEQLCRQCGTWLWDWSPDRKQILTWDRGSGLVRALLINLDTGKRNVFLESPDRDLYDFQWSPDGEWISFHAEPASGMQVEVAPFTGEQGPNENTWISITEEKAVNTPRWSPDGNWIYAISDRDGFDCLWAYPLNPQTKHLAGKPVAVFHSHRARLSIRNADLVTQGLSVAKDKVVFKQGELTGNIWMTELREQK